jgi:hypothetical protein
MQPLQTQCGQIMYHSCKHPTYEMRGCFICSFATHSWLRGLRSATLRGNSPTDSSTTVPRSPNSTAASSAKKATKRALPIILL